MSNEPAKEFEESPVWSAFVEIRLPDHPLHAQYGKAQSPEASDAAGKLGFNYFQEFADERGLLNYGYEHVRPIQEAFQQAPNAGYWLWVAENISNNTALGTYEPVVQDVFTREYASIDANEMAGGFSKELVTAMSNVWGMVCDSALEKSALLKASPFELVQDFKKGVMKLQIWGYQLGVAESRFRR